MDETWGVARALWEKVNEEREDRGWSWAELSRRSGVRRATIASLASNKEPPQPGNINKLADTLGLDRKEAHRLAKGGGSSDDDDPSVRTSITRSRRLSSRQKVLLLNLYDELVSGGQQENQERRTQPPDGYEPLRVVDGGNN